MVFLLENAFTILRGRLPELQWDNGWENVKCRVLHSCDALFFCLTCPRVHDPSWDPGQVFIHHSRLVQCHPGVQVPRKQRRPEGNLGEQGPSQGAGMEWDTRTSPQHLATDYELVSESAQCHPHLCGQQLCGQENCLCRLCASLFPWWVQAARGEGHSWSSSVLGWELWAFLPTLLLAPPSTWATPYRSLWSTTNLLLI